MDNISVDDSQLRVRLSTDKMWAVTALLISCFAIGCYCVSGLSSDECNVLRIIFNIVSRYYCCFSEQRTDHLPAHLVRPAEILHDICQNKTGALEGKLSKTTSSDSDVFQYSNLNLKPIFADDIKNSHSAHIVDTPEIRCYIYCLFESSNVVCARFGLLSLTCHMYVVVFYFHNFTDG